MEMFVTRIRRDHIRHLCSKRQEFQGNTTLPFISCIAGGFSFSFRKPLWACNNLILTTSFCALPQEERIREHYFRYWVCSLPLVTWTQGICVCVRTFYCTVCVHTYTRAHTWVCKLLVRKNVMELYSSRILLGLLIDVWYYLIFDYSI